VTFVGIVGDFELHWAQTSCLKNKLAWKDEPDDFLQFLQWQRTVVMGGPRRV
jgi:hypothetical protein